MKYRLRWGAAWAIVIVLALPAATSRATDQEMIDLQSGGKTVARYMPVPNPMKPYVKALFTPSGVQLLQDSPPDHVHHHGLMFAVGAGDTEYFCEKTVPGTNAKDFGRQVPRSEATRSTPALVEQTIDWTQPDGTRQLIERRTVRVHRCGGGGPNLLTWVTQLEPAEGSDPVKLWGRYYFGLGLRPVTDFDEEARFSVPAGTPPAKKVIFGELQQSAAWCAISARVGDKPVTVAIWDDPRNQPRAIWYTMVKPMAYLGATLGLPDWVNPHAKQETLKLNPIENPLTLQPGTTLTLRYGVAVFDGNAGADAIEKARDAWLAAENVVFKNLVPR